MPVRELRNFSPLLDILQPLVQFFNCQGEGIMKMTPKNSACSSSSAFLRLGTVFSVVRERLADFAA